MKLTKNGQRYHQPEVTPQESDSKPKEDLPLYLWAPECHENTKIFTEQCFHTFLENFKILSV